MASGQRFGTIYCDPPWRYGKNHKRGAADNHYVTMKMADIAALPVDRLSDVRSHLHLWTTTSFLKEALGLIDHWGFDYKSMMVWCKPGLGLGNYWRVTHEILLLGVKGQLTFNEHSHMSWQFFDRGRHSEKPEAFRQLIEKVSPAPRIELFGRRPCPGWTVFGNQVEPDNIGGIFEGMESNITQVER